MFKGPEHFSLPGGFQPEDISTVRIELQRALIAIGLLSLGKRAEDQQAKNNFGQEWINKYSDRFSLVFNSYLAENPSLIADWGDLDKREVIISEIKRRLEEEEPSLHSEAA